MANRLPAPGISDTRLIIIAALIGAGLLWIGFFISAVPAGSAQHQTGHKAPPFLVSSGDDQTLTVEDLTGKIVLLFYESREAAEKNRSLKNLLNAFYREQAPRLRQNICRVAVINCTAAVWPLQGIWKRELRKNSRQEGLTIYGDWDGRMLSAYGMKGGDSNLLIIDKKGIIRFFRSGAIPPDVIKEIQELLYAIGRE